MPRIRNAPLAVTLVTISVTLSTSVHCNGEGFAEKQIDCEAAAMQLANCCPGYDPNLITCERSTFTESETESNCGGGSTTTTTYYPTISESDSVCVQSEDCATLVATGVCKRAIEAAGNGSYSTVSPPPSQGGGCGGGYASYDSSAFYPDTYLPLDGGFDALFLDLAPPDVQTTGDGTGEAEPTEASTDGGASDAGADSDTPTSDAGPDAGDAGDDASSPDAGFDATLDASDAEFEPSEVDAGAWIDSGRAPYRGPICP